MEPRVQHRRHGAALARFPTGIRQQSPSNSLHSRVSPSRVVGDLCTPPRINPSKNSLTFSGTQLLGKVWAYFCSTKRVNRTVSFLAVLIPRKQYTNSKPPTGHLLARYYNTLQLVAGGSMQTSGGFASIYGWRGCGLTCGVL